MSDETGKTNETEERPVAGDVQPPAGPVCGHCGAPVSAGPRVCPNCGNVLPPLPVLAGADRKERYTAKDWLALIGGVLVSLASPFVAGLGLLAALVVWIVLRARGSTPFVRGMGIGLIIVGVCLLGAFGICIWFFVAESQGVH